MYFIQHEDMCINQPVIINSSRQTDRQSTGYMFCWTTCKQSIMSTTCNAVAVLNQLLGDCGEQLGFSPES